MDEDHFNHLVSLVSPLIKKEDTCIREAISPAERVALTLCFWPLESRSICSPFSFAYRDMPSPTLGQRLNLNVRFDWLNTEICVTLLHEMLQVVDTRNIASNISAVESRPTSATLRATNFGVDTRCNSAIAHNIVHNIAPCIRAFRTVR